MRGERLTLDPRAESTSNAQLDLHDVDNGLALLEHAYPLTEEQRQWAESADTEGARLASRRPVNRTITAKVRVAEPGDAASTNRITNPKAAVDLTGITNVGGTLSRAVLDGTDGPLPDETMPPVDTAVRLVGAASGNRGAWDVAVTNGQVSRFSVWVYRESGTAAVDLVVLDAGGAVITDSANLTTSGVWTRLDVTITPNATATWKLAVRQAAAGAATFVYTLGLDEVGANLGPYFDGDSAGCAWSGTSNASSSTRPAAGGDRLNAIIADLQAKVAKLQRDAGTLRRILPNGDPITFEIEAANIDVPSDKAFITRRRAEVTITLECAPYGLGAWTQLPDHTETTLPALIFTDTIPGDVPALAKMLVDNDSANTQRKLLWGVQARHYSAAATAALFYEAESCAIGSAGTAAVGPAGASGPGANKVVSGTALDAVNWDQLIYIGASSTAQTHVGKFRVLVRAYAPAANTGIVSLRAQWAREVGAATKINDAAAMVNTAGTALEDTWLLLDLGQITIPEASRGTQGWLGTIEGQTTAVGPDVVHLDCVMLIPVDDGWGDMHELSTTVAATNGSTEVAFDGVRITSSSGYWRDSQHWEGDPLRIPPGAPVRLFVKYSRPSNLLIDDPSIDDISARMTIRPRYLVVPAP